MASRGVKRALIAVPAVLLGLVLGALLVGSLRVGDWFEGPDPETIAAASLQSMREQARLTTMAGRYVAVVTSTQRRFGLSAEKTLIMPGLVRYEVDLAKLDQGDVAWDAATETLSVRLPPLEVSGPQIDFESVREYQDGRVLMALTDVEQTLDQANRRRGQQELIRQARQPMPMRLARDAAKKAVARSFAMPLRAAGIEANVEVRFADEAADDPSYLDRSRRIEDVLEERQRQR